jgi:YD repeat-containing protein
LIFDLFGLFYFLSCNLTTPLMRLHVVSFVALCALFFSCSKGELAETPTPPAPPPGDTTTLEPLRLIQTIYIHDDSGTLVNDTTDFSYDEAGRVTSEKYPWGLVETYTYNGDSLVSILQASQEILRLPIDVTKDTFTIDFIQNAGATDTVQLTYIFKNALQTEFWTYLHFREHDCGCMPERNLQKERKYYNGSGNLVKTTIETPPNFIEGDQYTVTAWDDKNNPKKTIPKFNALALGLPIPLESYSLHNPTAYSSSSQTYEVEMTYNDEGYPLTYKLKNQNFISARLKYNR